MLGNKCLLKLVDFRAAERLSTDTLRRFCEEIQKSLSKNDDSDVCGDETADEILNLPSELSND